MNSINDKTPIPVRKGDSSVTKVTKEAEDEEDLDSDDLEFEEFDYRKVGTRVFTCIIYCFS